MKETHLKTSKLPSFRASRSTTGGESRPEYGAAIGIAWMTIKLEIKDARNHVTSSSCTVMHIQYYYGNRGKNNK